MAQQRRSPPQQQRTQQRPAQRAAPAPARQSNLARREPDPFDDVDEEVSIVRPDSAALEALTKSEVSMQLDAAHRWPRNTRGFIEEASALACYSRDTAEACTYTLFRKERDEKTGTWVDKPITGPGVRLAEMCAPTWGNLHVASRIIEEGARTVTAQSIAWDLEKNLRLGVEVQRGIVTKKGDRYGDDMIRVTMMAAMSIAFRNAVFRVIPRALVNAVWEETKAFAAGDEKDLPDRRDRAVAWFTAKRGLPMERLLARMGVAKVEDLTREHVDILSGLCTSLKQNLTTMDEAFPPVQAVPPQQAAGTRSKGAALDALASAHKKSEPPPADDLPLTPELVHQALADADEAWVPGHLLATVKGWSTEQQRSAYNWAVTFMDTPNDQPPPEQPEFTLLPRQAGEEG